MPKSGLADAAVAQLGTRASGPTGKLSSRMPVKVGRRPEPKCVIDRSRACGSCIAPSPRECPYAYLLDPAELSAVADLGHGGGTPRLAGPPAGGR